MPEYIRVDKSKLFSALSASATAIRAKSSADRRIPFDLANETGFESSISAITGGGYQAGDWLDPAKPEGDITSDVAIANQYQKQHLLHYRSGIRKIVLTEALSISESLFENSGITVLVAPKAKGTGANACMGCSSLTAVDLGGTSESNPISQNTFNGCTHLSTIILRGNAIMPLSNINAFTITPFALDGAGGTIYIPESLYNHLGDGTALDYKSATNWGTIDARHTITWAKINGSAYETQYADGTAIAAQ